jgi:hypothetical protein
MNNLGTMMVIATYLRNIRAKYRVNPGNIESSSFSLVQVVQVVQSDQSDQSDYSCSGANLVQIMHVQSVQTPQVACS